MWYRFSIGLILLALLIGLSYYLTYREWDISVTSPQYSRFGREWHGKLSFFEATKLYTPGYTKVNIDFRYRRLSLTINLPKPVECVNLNGVNRVLTDQGLLPGVFYSTNVCINALHINAWNADVQKLVEKLLSLDYHVQSIDVTQGIYNISGMRACGPGLIRLLGTNIDKLENIKPYWSDCTYHEYRLLYESGAVLR